LAFGQTAAWVAGGSHLAGERIAGCSITVLTIHSKLTSVAPKIILFKQRMEKL
jgi:hypothetical protein